MPLAFAHQGYGVFAHIEQAHLCRFVGLADDFLQGVVGFAGQVETAQMCLLNGRKYTVALMREGERHFRIDRKSVV